jgi:hypothetical protein
MPSLFRVDKKVRNRVEPKRKPPVNIASASAAGSVLTVTFDQTVVLKADEVPQYTTDVAGAVPVPGGAVMTDATTLELTFSASIAAATEVIIPFEDSAIRNAVGGYVSNSTFPV